MQGPSLVDHSQWKILFRRGHGGPKKWNHVVVAVHDDVLLARQIMANHGFGFRCLVLRV